MKGRIFLIHWNTEEAAEHARELRSDGWNVYVESEDSARAYKRIKADPPDFVVIYLPLLPSHGRETADALRSSKDTRKQPVVFLGGSEEAIEKPKAKVPNAVFATSAELAEIRRRFRRLVQIMSEPTTHPLEYYARLGLRSMR
jgi:CheY-like chemotaxis protein